MSEFYNYFPLTSKSSYIVPDWRARFYQLITGMDSESIATVSRCLGILYHLEVLDAAGQPHPPLKAFLHDNEIEKLAQSEDLLNNGISQISESAWTFNGYILPTHFFEYCTFINEYSLPTMDLSGISPDAVIIDVGAFVGDSAIVFNRYLPNNKIYSFEPVDFTYRLLEQTVALNNLTDVIIPVNLALGDVPDSSARSIAFENINFAGISRLDESGDSLFAVDTLDNWVAKNNINRVGVIKVDIEGAEQKFLDGARRTIERDRPLMFLSIYHNPDDYFGIKPKIEEWGLNYQFKIFKPMNRDVITETLLICIPL